MNTVTLVPCVIRAWRFFRPPVVAAIGLTVAAAVVGSVAWGAAVVYRADARIRAAEERACRAQLAIWARRNPALDAGVARGASPCETAVAVGVRW